MSNYYPRTMNQWKIHKRSLEMDENLENSSTPRHRSVVIHSLGMPRNQKFHKQRDIELNRSHQSITDKKLQVGCLKKWKKGSKQKTKCQEVNRKCVQQRYRSDSALTQQRHLKLRSSTAQNIKQHHIRTNQTLKDLKSLGMEKILIISTPKEKVTPSKSSLVESSQRYFRKQINLTKFSSQEREQKVTSAREKNEPNQTQIISKEYKKNKIFQLQKELAENSSVQNFLLIKDCNLHFRTPKIRKTLKNYKERDDERYEVFQKMIRRRLKKAKNIKMQQLPISPWEYQEQQA